MSSQRRFSWIWSLALALAFAAGFLTDRYRVFLRPAYYSVTGRNSCGLLKAYSNLGHAAGEEAVRVRAQSALLEKTSDGFERWRTPIGEFWNPTGNELFFAVAEQTLHNYGSGQYRVKPGSIVLDCGANIGDFVRESLTAGAKLVVAIEPVPRNVACLRRTFAGEIAAGSVQIVEEAVWNEPGRMKMGLHRNTLLDGLVQTMPTNEEAATAFIEVPLTTIDALVAQLHLPRVDFIKLDIEGAEPNALRGARRTLASFRPQLAVATEHAPLEHQDVMAALREVGASYQSVCGACRMDDGSRYYPETLFLTPQ